MFYRSSVTAVVTCLAFAPLATRSALGQKRKGANDLTQVYTRWFRDFKAGKIEPGDLRGAARKPYLSAKLLADLPGRGEYYDRITEAGRLFGLLVDRGTPADGKRLLAVIATSLKKKGGHFWEFKGNFSRFRRAAVVALEAGNVTADVQAVLVDRVKAGLSEPAPVASSGRPSPAEKPEDKPAAGDDKKAEDREIGRALGRRTHKEPELATVLVPIIGRFGKATFRPVLEGCIEVAHSGLQAAAAKALARMKHGSSIVPVARALQLAVYADDITVLAHAVTKLVEATDPAPTERQLKFALGIALERLDSVEDWRARIALVPILRVIRARASVPFLISMLDKAKLALAKKSAKPNPGWSGTLVHAIHKVLVNLSGFYAPARDVKHWQEWWKSVRANFVVAKAKDQSPVKSGTDAREFFGIPVSGNRVAFVVDISGSMNWPYEAVTGATPGVKLKDGFETRLQRAKKEINRAVGSLPPDAMFNVIFFSSQVKAWKKKLVFATPKNKKALAKHLERVNASGGTAVYDGIDEALKIRFGKKKGKSATGIDELFLLSDGSPTMGTITSTKRILDTIHAWNQGAQIRVHAIYIGDEDVDKVFGRGGRSRLPGNMHAAEFMKKLAELNNGRFAEPNASDTTKADGKGGHKPKR